MTDKPLTRIQKRNREVILAAGLEVFAQYGFRGATLDQVAKAAAMSKPNIIYYFGSKEVIYTTILEGLLDTWLEPLHEVDPNGDPIQEVLAYMHRKLDLSRDFPAESRLFANEILQGAPRMTEALEGHLRNLVAEKAKVIQAWADAGKIEAVDPTHLIFSIWSLTQHYADFDTQVRAVLPGRDPYPAARAHIELILRKTLAP